MKELHVVSGRHPGNVDNWMLHWTTKLIRFAIKKGFSTHKGPAWVGVVELEDGLFTVCQECQEIKDYKDGGVIDADSSDDVFTCGECATEWPEDDRIYAGDGTWNSNVPGMIQRFWEEQEKKQS